MLYVNNFMMETSKFNAILLLCCVYITCCYSLRPQNSHDEFVVKKFEDKFLAKEEFPTTGPYQINIPLRIDGEHNEEKIDITTIKSPMRAHINEKYGIDRNPQEIILKDLPNYYYYPPKPLNERPLELKWLAWLLEDVQNQSEDQLNSDEVFRGRILPKHIFDSPTFRPTCATGYSLDHTGKCAKIIILNEDGLSKFWGEKVNDKIGPIDYPDDGEGEYSRIGAHIDVIMPLTLFGEVANSEISDSKGDAIQDSLKTTENYPTTITVSLLDSEKTSTVIADLSTVTTTNTNLFTSTDRSEDSAVLSGSTSSNEELPAATIDLFTSNREFTTLAPDSQVTQIESSSSNLIPVPDQPRNQNILDSAFVNFPDSGVSLQAEVSSSTEQTTMIRVNEFSFPKLLYRGKQRTIIPGKKRRKYNRRNPNKRNNVFIFPSVKSAQL